MNANKASSEGTAIHVRAVGSDEPAQFEVLVQDSKNEIQYRVTMSRADFKRLGRGCAMPEECIRAAFRFLLDREPKEAILRRFDISVIERYFPEFPREFSCDRES